MMISPREMREIAQRGEQWLRENAPESMFSYGIGPAIMFSYISERNINSMITGTVVALVLISFTLLFALRSLRLLVLGAPARAGSAAGEAAAPAASVPAPSSVAEPVEEKR